MTNDDVTFWPEGAGLLAAPLGVIALSAFDELQSSGGMVGRATVALLRRLTKQVTRNHSFPPLEGRDRWDNDAADDLISAMFEAKGAQVVQSCFLKASDQASLERVLLAAIRNFLIDQAKSTERGKLRRRLETVLGGDSGFVRVQSGFTGWAVPGCEGRPWQGDLAELSRAAFAVRGVQIRRWNTSGPTPKETADALRAVASAVLTVAGGVVRDEDLARTVQGRFELLAIPVVMSLDADDGWSNHTGQPSTDVLAECSPAAGQLWQDMTPAEHALLPHLGAPGAELTEIIGVGPKRARVIADRLADRIRLTTIDDADREQVVLQLLQLARFTHKDGKSESPTEIGRPLQVGTSASANQSEGGTIG